MKIENQSHINQGVSELCQGDKVLAKIAEKCGTIPLRLSEPGFAGLASIITSQQVSKASADAIFGRLKTFVEPLEAENFLKAGQEKWKTAGLSRPKQATLVGVAEAIIAGQLDLDNLCEIEPEDAMAQMTALKGIGPWTAEIYLMFCAGHSDIFAAGDLALQEAIKIAYNLDERPNEKETRKRAQNWKPWRSIAARLLWEFYRIERRDGTPM